MRIKVTKQARRHKISKTRMYAAMSNEPVESFVNERNEIEHRWRAETDGFEIEVTAVETTDDRTGDAVLLVVHAMPTDFRN